MESPAAHCTDAFEAGDVDTIVTVLSMDSTSQRPRETDQ
jgi:hypothetical protein